MNKIYWIVLITISVSISVGAVFLLNEIPEANISVEDGITIWKNGTFVSYWKPSDYVYNWGFEITHTDGFFEGETMVWAVDNKDLPILEMLESGKWYSFGVCFVKTGHADETISILVFIDDSEGKRVWSYY